MDVEALLLEKIKFFESLKNQLQDLNKQVGALKEQQQALYNQALQVKGAIDSLIELKEKMPASKTATLTLPEGVAPGQPEVPSAETTNAAPAPAVTMEVQ